MKLGQAWDDRTIESSPRSCAGARCRYCGPWQLGGLSSRAVLSQTSTIYAIGEDRCKEVNPGPACEKRGHTGPYYSGDTLGAVAAANLSGLMTRGGIWGRRDIDEATSLSAWKGGDRGYLICLDACQRSELRCMNDTHSQGSEVFRPVLATESCPVCA
jgi:hypothetical protein